MWKAGVKVKRSHYKISQTTKNSFKLEISGIQEKSTVHFDSKIKTYIWHARYVTKCPCGEDHVGEMKKNTTTISQNTTIPYHKSESAKH